MLGYLINFFNAMRSIHNTFAIDRLIAIDVLGTRGGIGTPANPALAGLLFMMTTNICGQQDAQMHFLFRVQTNNDSESLTDIAQAIMSEVIPKFPTKLLNSLPFQREPSCKRG